MAQSGDGGLPCERPVGDERGGKGPSWRWATAKGLAKVEGEVAFATLFEGGESGICQKKL